MPHRIPQSALTMAVAIVMPADGPSGESPLQESAYEYLAFDKNLTQGQVISPTADITECGLSAFLHDVTQLR